MTLEVDEAHVQVPAGEGGRGTPFNIDYCGLFNLLMKALWHLLCAKICKCPMRDRGGGVLLITCSGKC